MSVPDPVPSLARWVLVLPVQSATRGKSRLEVPPGVVRSTLARAIALDSLAAVRSTPSVACRVVVTADDDLARDCGAAGDSVVRDGGNSLTAAIERGLAVARSLAPASPTAVLLPDVPALTSDDLATALDAASGHGFAVVPDAEGSGSVLLTAMPGRELRTAFGVDSARRHHELGADVLDLDLPRLRRDVDTRDALRQAAALGLGPASRAALGPALAELERAGRSRASAH
jgi:2-phospho-L-lactate/phosphoenolpyruvate guanylyltransferase